MQSSGWVLILRSQTSASPSRRHGRACVTVRPYIDADASRAVLISRMSTLSLYLHWPFCLAKCPYCDFNSHVRERIPQARFRAALRRELAWEAERLGRRRPSRSASHASSRRSEEHTSELQSQSKLVC